MKTHKRGLALLLAALIAIVWAVPYAGAVSTTTLQISMLTNPAVPTVNDTVYKPEATVNGTVYTLEAGALLVGDKPYVPLKFLGDTMGVKVQWNEKTRLVEMVAGKAKIEFDLAQKQVLINGVSRSSDTIAYMSGDKLLVRLDWFADYTGAKQYYDAAARKIDIVYVKRPDEISDSSEVSQPVAKFTFAKSTYKVGEPIEYVDLSYDPDAEGLPKYEWSGKQDAFFTSGTYSITLKVTDGSGHVSKPYTRTIKISPDVYIPNELEYKMHFLPVGSFIKTDWSMIWAKFWDLPILPTKVVEDRSRTLIVSDSPETIMQKGILYQERVNGKARLYADHVNGTEDKVQFVIMARNTSNKPVTIKTTNKGEVYPSIYANLIGHEASVDFMLHDPQNIAPLVVPPGQGYVYVQMPDFYPGQGVNVFYDVETDGEIEFSFVAMDNSISTPTSASLGFYKPLDFNGHVRGTFPVADKTWNVDMSSFTRPQRLTIGDGKDDPFVAGYDQQRRMEVKNDGNYGMLYHIHADKPRKMAVLLMAKGGVFKGPFKINNNFVMAPGSGVLPAFEKVQVLARTTGKEDSFDIEFTPPAGSAFPIDIIFWPLDELE
ncbi:MAG: copper amine oxidase N-terminal domain-containing protein [Paenibacillaceae bacterium]|nr:copper amine oxidase N-terminal domain-containing protein [Paenibacillaceae bacterium]